MVTSEQARALLEELNGKLAAADARSIELENEATSISLAAMTGDGGSARKRLDALNRERATCEIETRNIRSAIRAQEAVATEAERAEDTAAAAENAAAVMNLADSLAERGRRIDEAFARAREELEGFRADMNALHLLGVTSPRAEQFNVLGGLALMTHLMMLPLKVDRDHLGTRERRTFTETADGWRAQIARTMAPFLDKAEAA